MHAKRVSPVIKEFEVIKNEWNRRLALRKFEVAFKIKKGRIKGKPFSLNFTHPPALALRISLCFV